MSDDEVYILVGWFGDTEWIEGVYADQKKAESRSWELWCDRASDKGPAYAKGVHKFGVETWPVLT